MNLFESFRVALVALRTNKMRSLLTMLGIIIGVGAVIGMLAIGNGLQQFLDSQFDQLGIGSFYVFAGIDSKKISDQAGAAADSRRRRGAARSRARRRRSMAWRSQLGRTRRSAPAASQ